MFALLLFRTIAFGGVDLNHHGTCFFLRPCEFSWLNLREGDGMEKKHKNSMHGIPTELGSFRDLAANVPLCIRVSENGFLMFLGKQMTSSFEV